MNKLKSVTTNQLPFFVISFIIFITAVTLGWQRLHYGLNFTDEGYYMTEAWRLTVGDHLFQVNKYTGAIDMSPVINSFFFRIDPDITLLGFRKIQFILTICALLLFSVALYKITKLYWFQPLILSLFAFTGIDTTGLIPNLSYHTYPHLFIILHLAFLLLGFRQESVALRRTLFVVAGFFLWLISFTLLHMSLVLFSPIILFYFFRKWKTDYVSFDFVDLCFVYAPILLCWSIFIAIFNKDYLYNILISIKLMMSPHIYSPDSLIHNIINWEMAKYIFINSVFLIIFLALLRFQKIVFLICGSILCLLMYFIIDTSFWGLVHPPMWLIFYSRPIWLASLLISMYLLFLLYILWKILTRNILSEAEVISLILLTPCIILFSGSAFSINGLIYVLWASVPAVGSISILLLSNGNVKKQSYLIKLLILFIFFVPFYYSTAWSGWHYPYLDVAPEYANETIDYGFGQEIKTNLLYKSLYDWVSTNAEQYTSKDDFILSYTCSPMVYMIAKRRPSLDSSWVVDNLYYLIDYYENAIDSMKKNGREPKMAFVFENLPGLLPIEKSVYAILPKQFSFPSKDPISQYIVQNMSFLNQFQMQDFTVRCFIRR